MDAHELKQKIDEGIFNLFGALTQMDLWLRNSAEPLPEGFGVLMNDAGARFIDVRMNVDNLYEITTGGKEV